MKDIEDKSYSAPVDMGSATLQVPNFRARSTSYGSRPAASTDMQTLGQELSKSCPDSLPITGYIKSFLLFRSPSQTPAREREHIATQLQPHEHYTPLLRNKSADDIGFLDADMRMARADASNANATKSTALSSEGVKGNSTVASVSEPPFELLKQECQISKPILEIKKPGTTDSTVEGALSNLLQKTAETSRDMVKSSLSRKVDVPNKDVNMWAPSNF